MNIKEAGKQIRNSVKIYLTTDEFGRYVIPVEKQRPLFLFGPPGIGKTAIMRQIADELGIGLVMYSMTHHTRQSALGLPFISHKVYDGAEYDISEYTMSEIIASVYDCIEKTGKKQGILFLDEINCVSETLSPVMLQFLQYKTFGRYRVPDGWIVVTAGNPPEYNDSVREFDAATWDRVKRIDITPDLGVWKEYAYDAGVHPAIVTYLDVKPDNFYKITTTVDGKELVTARGWEDLSKMITAYEAHGLTVDKSLICQYISNKNVVRGFASYYDLFNKYRREFMVDDVLAGKASEAVKERARKARFDERVTLIGLIVDNIHGKTIGSGGRLSNVPLWNSYIKDIKQKCAALSPAQAFDESIEKAERLRGEGDDKSDRPVEWLRGSHEAADKFAAFLKDRRKRLKNETDGVKAGETVKADYIAFVKKLYKGSEKTTRQLSNAFQFLEEVWPGGQEMLIFVTELTADKSIAEFITRFGCPEYFKYSKELHFSERCKELITETDEPEAI